MLAMLVTNLIVDVASWHHVVGVSGLSRRFVPLLFVTK